MAARTSWRDSRMKQAANSSVNRIFRRLMMTAVVLATIGAFLYVVFRPAHIEPKPVTRIVAVAVERTASSRIPELAYPEAKLPGLDAKTPADAKPGNPLKGADIQQVETSIIRETEARSLQKIGNRLATQGGPETKAPNALIVLVRAEGVSLDGRPRILCNDFDGLIQGASLTADGTVDFKVVLDGVAKSGAGLKLIVCDYGRTNIVPEYGIFQNDFADLVSKDVHDVGDDSVYVLLSHERLQLSQLQHDRFGSVFFNAVTDILNDPWNYAGDHPAKGDDAVTIKQFVTEVEGRCAAYCTDAYRQTPVLLRGKYGSIESSDLPDAFLIAASPPPEPPKETKPDEKGKQASNADFKRQPAQASLFPAFTLAQAPVPASEASKTVAEPKSAEPAPATTPPAATSTPAANGADSGNAKPVPAANPPASATPSTSVALPTVAAEVPKDPAVQASVAAWQSFHRLIDRKETPWSSVDFSPSATRRIGQELCRLDMLLWVSRRATDPRHAGAIADATRAAERLGQLADAMKTESRKPSGADGDLSPKRLADALARLQDDWSDFFDSRATIAAEFRKVKADGRTGDALDVWKRGEDLLFRLPWQIERFDQLSQTRTVRPIEFQQINELIRLCGHLNWPAEWSAATGLDPAGLGSLEARVAKCEAIEQQLLKQLNEDDADEMIRGFKKDRVLDIESGRRAESLLLNPLLDPVMRTDLLIILLKPGDRPPVSPQPKELDEKSEPWRLDRASERAISHWELVQLAAGQESATAAPTSDMGSFGTKYLAEWSRIASGFANRKPQELRMAMLACDLVDSAAGRAARATLPDVRLQKPVEPEQLELAAEGPTQLYLAPPPGNANGDPGPWQSLALKLSRKGRPSGPIELVVAGELPRGVEVAFNKRPPGQPFPPIESQEPLEQTVSVEVRATSLASLWGAAPIKLLARSPGRQSTVELEVFRPTANQVRLVPINPDGEVSDLKLRVYSGVATSVGLAAVNETGRDVELEFELLNSPMIFGTDEQSEANWKLLRDQLVDLKAGTLKRASLPHRLYSAKLTLKAGERAVIPFAVPKPPAPDPATPGAAPPPAAAPMAPPARDISNGLICLIREPKPVEHIPAVIAVEPIRMQIIHPRDFLSGQATYDPRNRQIAITVSRSDPADTRPIDVLISNADKFGGGPKRIRGELKEQSVTVFVTSPDEAALQRVEVDVDRYPRAFLFDVSAEKADRAVDPKRDVRSVQVRRLVVPERPIAFLIDAEGRATAVANPAAPKEPPPSPVELELTSDRPMTVAPLKGPLEKLNAEIAVDWPADLDGALTFSRDDSAIDVVTSDRRRSFTLQSVADSGMMDVQCAVSDWMFEVPFAGDDNIQVNLSALLEISNADGTSEQRQSATRTLIDSRAPEVQRPARAVMGDREMDLLHLPAMGTGLQLIAVAGDHDIGAGVRRCEFQVFDTDDTPKGMPMKARSIPGNLWAADFSALKELMPGNYRLKTRAVDRLGQWSDARIDLLHVELAATPGKTPMAEKGAIRGKVVFGKGGKGGVTVTLVELKKKATTQAGGGFVFTDVPKGTYHLEASSFSGGTKLTGKLDGVQPDLEGGDPTDHELILKE